LLVEDELSAARMLAKGLREQAYAVDVATDGEEALYQASINDYDLVILDVMLPLKDGFEVCRQMRAGGSAVPVLMLTARDNVADRITGLDTGADDYLSKPFDFHELLARVRALLRRGPVLRTETIQLADLTIDTQAQRVRRAGRIVELTGKEYALLDYLARHTDRVVGRAEIAEHVWDEHFDPLSNLIEVYIQRLRRKIDEGRSCKLLRTIRGGGYMLSSGETDYVGVLSVILIAFSVAIYIFVERSLYERLDASLYSTRKRYRSRWSIKARTGKYEVKPRQRRFKNCMFLSRQLPSSIQQGSYSQKKPPRVRFSHYEISASRPVKRSLQNRWSGTSRKVNCRAAKALRMAAQRQRQQPSYWRPFLHCNDFPGSRRALESQETMSKPPGGLLLRDQAPTKPVYGRYVRQSGNLCPIDGGRVTVYIDDLKRLCHRCRKNQQDTGKGAAK